ncbi:hypothetical protein Cgig2_000059 [Carnegiea gigantea]|uniref:Uncharacterized protein n=1 Tax=Carnegiea gigantea TaxID=171969 RepID=A0A9Q1L0L9_9CARY|nr:hypothetical protein Cgig2_000059 [Carnegiea gigantea]
MRIRRSAPSSISPSSLSSCSSSSGFSSSPYSTISSQSLSSSSNSTFSFFSLSPNQRCEGLDLLVKAVYHVAGSVVGVPYIQRRVIRRRKPAIRFRSFVIGLARENENEDEDKGQVFDSNVQVHKKKQRRRSIKYPNSVLQSWKLSDRPRMPSGEIEMYNSF